MSLATIAERSPLAAWSIPRTLRLEGGLVDLAADPGGVTNGGISLRWALAEIKVDPSTARWLDIDHDGHVDRKDIVGLTDDEKADILFECWWLPGWYGQLAPQLVAWKCFDIAVNTGPKRAGILLQKALSDVGPAVPVDSHVGPTTIAAVMAQAAADNGAKLLAAIRSRQAAFYRRLALLEPDLHVFLNGWLARAAA